MPTTATRRLGGGFCVTGPCLPGLTMAAEEGRRNRTTGRCKPVWEELEMGLQRKIHFRI